jgi:hypothetical protein
MRKGSMAALALKLLGSILLCAGCGAAGSSEGVSYPVPPVPEEAWRALGSKRIYFGHKSVGANIVDGLRDLGSANPLRLVQVDERPELADPGSGALLHGPVGRNGRPSTKLQAFAERLDLRVGAWADYAFFKLCYVDIESGADVPGLFREYETVMTALRERHPGTTFVHVTVPITARLEGPRVLWVLAKRAGRKVLGREDWEAGFYDNSARNEYNALLRERYLGREPIFDLAALEAGENQRNGPFLRRSLTDDGGHLNELGRREIASHLLAFLAGLAAESPAGKDAGAAGGAAGLLR